jgi:3-hydroxyisobutyrate dehydrogenase
MAIIAFIGVGNMGGGMALNLVKAGHEVWAFDPSADALARVVAGGATAASGAADAAAGADVIITMLPAGSHVRAAYEGGLFAAAQPHAVLIDCSTIDVATAKAMGEAAEHKGLAMVDAPVSGGTAAADGGTLTFMVGGPAAAFEQARPILEKMGKAVIHAGGAGMGQAAKICNNMILGISMIGVGEAFVLAEKLGLSHQALFDVASTSSGQCWSLTTYCPVPGPVPTSPANNGYRPGFAADLMLKDLKLSQEAAMSAGAATPLGAAAMQIYAMLQAAGKGGEDFSSVINYLRGTDAA